MDDTYVYLCVPMDIEHAQSICSWRYPEPYDMYNWQSWLDMQTNSFEFGDPQIRLEQYMAVLNPDQELIGFAQLFPMLGVTRLGLGLHPALCGSGNGSKFARAIAEEARRRTPDHEIDLEVLTWNLRAYHAYLKAGFVHTDTYERTTPSGLEEVHCMVFDE
ncbi:MAG: GNAT family N-acetyltransferase [Paenibacillaceae bacterium]